MAANGLEAGRPSVCLAVRGATTASCGVCVTGIGSICLGRAAVFASAGYGATGRRVVSGITTFSGEAAVGGISA